jgi:hypothetical protein
MTVRPTSTEQSRRPEIGRATSAPAPASARSGDAAAPTAPRAGRDDVRISEQARELQQLDAGRGPSGELAPDRLKELLGRVASGYYDSPQVRTEVVRKLAQELNV